MKKYGVEYKQERQKKLESQRYPHDEVTYRTDHLETHHVVPKLFDGVDIKENLIVLCRDFHAYLHHVCNVKNNELVAQRSFYAKKLWNDPLANGAEKAQRQLAEIDNVLMREWVENTVHNIGDRFRDKILEVTLLSHMNTIRELKIENAKLKEQLKRKE